MTDIDALIDKLEAAAEGSRELDQDIYHCLGLCQKLRDGTCVDYKAPLYTTSLDAAFTLVPKNQSIRLIILPQSIVGKKHMAWVNVNKRERSGNASMGNTPALALCIAALRAIKAKETGE